MSQLVTDDFDVPFSPSTAASNSKHVYIPARYPQEHLMDKNPPPIAKVWSWKRMKTLTIPVIPPLSSTSTSQTPVTPAPTKATLRAPKCTPWEKVDDVLMTHGFESLGEFLEALFHHHPTDDMDPQTPCHKATVTSFLQGSNKLKMAHLRPSPKSAQAES
ncbi:hypothetical protein C8R44DRAFT_892953 [Mycena epipterygia]|nr:hypothetical protein C8R44DRAFT_892953 [Mycena epipterygia]